MTSYHMVFKNGYFGSINKCGGLPTHLPEIWPQIDGADLAFLFQLYCDGEKLNIPNTLCIQGYQLFENGDYNSDIVVIQLPLDAKENIQQVGLSCPVSPDYCSIEAKSQMFNVFFELDGKIKTLNEMGIVPSRAMELLRTGTHRLDKIKEVCAKYNYPTPTEIKMIYDVKTKKFNVGYQYKEICSAKTNISAGEVFMNWVTAKKNEST